jgi:hypothetical protein
MIEFFSWFYYNFLKENEKVRECRKYTSTQMRVL